MTEKGLRRLVESPLPQDFVDVQRSTLGLDVVPRYICNTWDEATNNGGKPFDAIVIGAGMFGGYCADKLFRFGEQKNLRVLVLDAGPFLLPTHAQNLPRLGLTIPDPILPSADSGTPREHVWGMPWRSNVEWVGQAYCVGGKSLFWGGWCPRLLQDDLANWPPNVASYLAHHYSLLERQTGVEPDTAFIQGPLFQAMYQRIHTAIEQGRVANLHTIERPPLAVEGQSPASGLLSFDKFSSVTLLIDAAREAAGVSDDQRRFFVVPNAHVSRLIVADGAVRGIQAWVDGQMKFLTIHPSCSVVLASGMIESTRLALASFPTSGDPAKELMGRNLISHIRSNTVLRIRRSALDGQLPSHLQTGAVLVRGGTQDGQFHLQITASADVTRDSDRLLYSMIPDMDLLDDILTNQEDADWISLTIRGASEMRGDRTTPVPNTSGRWINLSPSEYDEFGIPRAFVQLTTTPSEQALAQAMDNAALQLAYILANNNSADLAILSGPARDPLGSTYHEAGTLWMGSDPATSVTNEDGRFHHVSNAYCCDQSLFVSVGSVNPTLTGLVLSHKVAEAIAAR